MPYFKVVSGKHREGKKIYNIGDVVEHEAQLDEIFQNKFEEVEAPVKVKTVEKEEKVQKPARSRGEEDETPKTESVAKPNNNDLQGLKIVHKGGGRFNVINTETDEPINDELLTKAEAEELAGIK